MTAPAFAAAAPSCDLFRQRLENAPTVLKLRNLPQKIELTPVSTSFNQQVWKSEVGGGKDRIPLSAHVYCEKQKFRSFTTDIAFRGAREQIKLDMIAAAIYALTGWQPDAVMKAAGQAVEKQPHNIKKIDLPGVQGSIGMATFEIDIPNDD